MVYWRTADGKRISIRDLGDTHLTRILYAIVREAGREQKECLLRLILEHDRAIPSDRFRLEGDMAQLDYEYYSDDDNPEF